MERRLPVVLEHSCTCFFKNKLGGRTQHVEVVVVVLHQPELPVFLLSAFKEFQHGLLADSAGDLLDKLKKPETIWISESVGSADGILSWPWALMLTKENPPFHDWPTGELDNREGAVLDELGVCRSDGLIASGLVNILTQLMGGVDEPCLDEGGGDLVEHLEEDSPLLAKEVQIGPLAESECSDEGASASEPGPGYFLNEGCCLVFFSEEAFAHDVVENTAVDSVDGMRLT